MSDNHNIDEAASVDRCAELQARIAAYALGEATDDAEVRDHLAECPDCQRDMRWYAQIARMLPYSAPPVEPPPGLGKRIVATVAAAVEQEQAQAHARLRPRRWTSWQLPAFGFALALLIALLFWNVSLQRQITAQTAQISASRENWRMMTALLNAPDVQWYTLSSETAEGHFWASQQQQIGCLVVEHLPPLQADQVYQVWLANSAERVSGGTFESRNGSAWILLHPDHSIADYQTVGITIEPRGGSPAPTGARVLFGSIAKT